MSNLGSILGSLISWACMVSSRVISGCMTVSRNSSSEVIGCLPFERAKIYSVMFLHFVLILMILKIQYQKQQDTNNQNCSPKNKTKYSKTFFLVIVSTIQYYQQQFFNMSANQNFGIMDQGYFVPRTQIIAWVNDLLKINVTKIQELGSGAVYCQILDAIYPGKVLMSKVNWKAKNDYEFIANYKILQNSFEKLGIKRYVEVQKLSKARYQDNLEFIQWMKRYYDVNSGENTGYPAEERRGTIKIDFSFAEKIVVPKTFNAGGQIINKKLGSKQKRAESGTSAQKQSAKRLTSPTSNDRAPRPKNSSNQKRGSIIDHNKESKQIIKKASSHLPPTPSQKLRQQQKTETIKQESTQEVYRPSKATTEQLQKYKKIVRELQSKLQMISQITQAGDDAETKLKLIEDVLSINFSKFGKVSDFLPSNIYQDQHFKHIDTIKTEEIKEEIVNNESLANYENVVTKNTSQSQSPSVKQSGRKDEEEQAF